jgi:signal transduction histidine kinase
MLATLSEQLASARARTRDELDGLRRHLEHVTAILASQQGLARLANERIQTELPAILHEAARAASLAAAGVRVEYDHGAVPALVLDPHKLLQILINLLANARESLLEVPPPRRGAIRIRTRVHGGRAVIEISDDGVGIPSASLPRIFEHGFTTKRDGHGFGLHVSALAAAELGGSLAGHSEGPGRGATFTLSLPLEAVRRG